MKKILLFAIAIVSILFTSCNKPTEEAKFVSELDSLKMRDGLDRDCMVSCYFSEELDEWMNPDEAHSFFFPAILDVKSKCNYEGSFIPKRISCTSVDTIITENGLTLYHCPVLISFYASNAFGVQDLISDLSPMFFFKNESTEDEDSHIMLRINTDVYPNENNDYMKIYMESAYKDCVIKHDKLDAFELDGIKYIISKM